MYDEKFTTNEINEMYKQFASMKYTSENEVDVIMIKELKMLREQLKTEQQAHKALKEKLKELEWSSYDQRYDANSCPACNSDERNGHKKDCWLAKSIEGVKVDE